MANERCGWRVWEGDHTCQCSRNGTVQREGKWYCWQHDPEAKKKRDAEKRANWDKKHKERRRERAAMQACDGISTDDLERLKPGELARLLAKEAPDGS